MRTSISGSIVQASGLRDAVQLRSLAVGFDPRRVASVSQSARSRCHGHDCDGGCAIRAERVVERGPSTRRPADDAISERNEESREPPAQRRWMWAGTRIAATVSARWRKVGRSTVFPLRGPPGSPRGGGRAERARSPEVHHAQRFRARLVRSIAIDRVRTTLFVTSSSAEAAMTRMLTISDLSFLLRRSRNAPSSARATDASCDDSPASRASASRVSFSAERSLHHVDEHGRRFHGLRLFTAHDVAESDGLHRGDERVDA